MRLAVSWPEIGCSTVGRTEGPLQNGAQPNRKSSVYKVWYDGVGGGRGKETGWGGWGLEGVFVA